MMGVGAALIEVKRRQHRREEEEEEEKEEEDSSQGWEAVRRLAVRS